jgi:ketosteroid isomerase-like protein
VSEEIDVIRRLARCWNTGDIDGFLACSHPDIVFRTDTRWVDGGEFSGHEQLRHFIEDFAAYWDSVKLEFGDVEETDGPYLVPSRWVARGKSSGLDTELAFTSVFWMRDGLMARAEVYFDREDALRAAGG